MIHEHRTRLKIMFIDQMKNNLTQKKKNEELCAYDYTYMHIITHYWLTLWQWHSNTSKVLVMVLLY